MRYIFFLTSVYQGEKIRITRNPKRRHWPTHDLVPPMSFFIHVTLSVKSSGRAYRLLHSSLNFPSCVSLSSFLPWDFKHQQGHLPVTDGEGMTGVALSVPPALQIAVMWHGWISSLCCPKYFYIFLPTIRKQTQSIAPYFSYKSSLPSTSKRAVTASSQIINEP